MNFGQFCNRMRGAGARFSLHYGVAGDGVVECQFWPRATEKTSATTGKREDETVMDFFQRVWCSAVELQ